MRVRVQMASCLCNTAIARVNANVSCVPELKGRSGVGSFQAGNMRTSTEASQSVKAEKHFNLRYLPVHTAPAPCSLLSTSFSFVRH